MQDTMRIGAAALGGYVLGRTKKAKAALGLALWLSGRGRPRDLARDQVVKALQSERSQELIAQLRGPALTAGKQAAMSAFESQAGRLSDSLSRRTDQISEVGRGTAGRGRRAVTKGSDTAERLSERRRRPSGRQPGGRRSRGRSAPAEEEEAAYDDEYDAEEEEPVEDEEEAEYAAEEEEPEYEAEEEEPEYEAEEEEEEAEEEEPEYEAEYEGDEEEYEGEAEEEPEYEEEPREDEVRPRRRRERVSA
jgi:hypothetical protein